MRMHVLTWPVWFSCVQEGGTYLATPNHMYIVTLPVVPAVGTLLSLLMLTLVVVQTLAEKDKHEDDFFVRFTYHVRQSLHTHVDCCTTECLMCLCTWFQDRLLRGTLW